MPVPLPSPPEQPRASSGNYSGKPGGTTDGAVARGHDVAPKMPSTFAATLSSPMGALRLPPELPLTEIAPDSGGSDAFYALPRTPGVPVAAPDPPARIEHVSASGPIHVGMGVKVPLLHSDDEEDWSKPFTLGSPPVVLPYSPTSANARPFTAVAPPVSFPVDAVTVPPAFSAPASPYRPKTPVLVPADESPSRNFTPASDTLGSPPVPVPAFNGVGLGPTAAGPPPPVDGTFARPSVPIGFARKFGTGVPGIAATPSASDGDELEPPPVLPPAIDLPGLPGSPPVGEDGARILRISSAESAQSRGGCRAQMLHDYARIYTDPNGAPTTAGESQIQIAGGDLFIDGRVDERWDLGKKIGEGGFSTVYRATRKVREDGGHKLLPEEVAIKVILKRPEPFNRRMVEREVFSYRLLAMVGGHENIVKLYEVSEDDKNVYLIMELLEGGELFSCISERGQYTERDAANLVVSMLASLSFCHRLNLKHRDVKPENFVFLKDSNDDTELKLTDFGIAHYSEDPTAMCKTMCGTPLYIAPEVLFRQPYGAEADLWSLGVIVYIMLAGAPPFQDHDLVQLVKKIKYKPASFDGPEWTLISDHGKEFVMNLLDKDKSGRMTAQQALEHPWLQNSCESATANVLEVAQVNIKSFVMKKRWKVAIQGVKAIRKFARIIDPTNPTLSGAYSDFSGPNTGDSVFRAPTPVDDFGEDGHTDSDPGSSLWGKLRRDRILQPRRPRSRNTSRFAASRDRSSAIDWGFVGPSGDLTPQSSYDSRTMRARESSKSRSDHAGLRSSRSADLAALASSSALASSPEPLSSSMSSVDPVSVGVGKAVSARRAPPEEGEAADRQQTGRLFGLWKGRRVRVASHISEPGVEQEKVGARTYQSHHGMARGPRFKLFRRDGGGVAGV